MANIFLFFLFFSFSETVGKGQRRKGGETVEEATLNDKTNFSAVSGF